MANRVPLTRYFVDYAGAKRQLFKVRDKGDELIIIFSSAEMMHGNEFDGRKILEQRYSVHASNQSEHRINEIKQTLRLEGGDLIETVLDARGPKANELQIIFSRACPRLVGERYDVTERPGDTLVKVADCDPSKQTLLYAVFLTSLDGPKSPSGSPRFRQVSHDFASFRLIVVYSYVALPSRHEGRLIHELSNAPRLNKAEIAKFRFSEGLSQRDATARALFSLGILHREVLALARNDLPDDIFILTQELRFGVWTEDELSDEIGRIARRLSAVFPKH